MFMFLFSFLFISTHTHIHMYKIISCYYYIYNSVCISRRPEEFHTFLWVFWPTNAKNKIEWKMFSVRHWIYSYRDTTFYASACVCAYAYARFILLIAFDDWSFMGFWLEWQNFSIAIMFICKALDYRSKIVNGICVLTSSSSSSSFSASLPYTSYYSEWSREGWRVWLCA